MSGLIELPDYREQSAEVARRFREIYERPKVLEVSQMGRIFQSAKGDVEALRGIDFAVHRREFVCVIGQSGCGKSTLIRILAGLDFQTSGEVLMDGEPIEGPGPNRGMVFQGYTLFPWLTVKQNVMFGPQMAGKKGPTAESEALQWIEMVGLERFADSYPRELSGGMKQRVAIARALANQPRILLMDEPFGALDAQTRCQMQKHLLQIWRAVDVTVLFITHDLEEAILLADRILVLGANPGHVEEIVEVPVPRPRSVEQLLSPEFLATKKRLEELIHPENDEREEFKIPKLTPAGDEVE
ncbi:MAG: ABC transporter ATP-binding protein [Verrucomicrobiota bacterium]